MKVKELIQQIKEFEDFDVEFLINGDTDALVFKMFTVTEINDVGYSDKVVVLTGTEK